MDFLHVRLDAPAPSLAHFYRDTLGLEAEDDAIRVGATRLEFRAVDGEPFYHFALLAPGNRAEAMVAWASERIELLPGPDGGDVVFDFANWDATACYFHDPAGNIVELIAHRGLGESDVDGPFSAGELLGLSELGLVGEPAAIARELRAELGLEVWDGSVSEHGRLAFVGEKARTLILAPPGRGWLPTGRPAEPHPLEAVLTSPPEGEAAVDGYTIRR